jgi:hypothetical protein
MNKTRNNQRAVCCVTECIDFTKAFYREPRNRPRRTHRVSGGIAQLFLNLGTRRVCVVSIIPRPPLLRERPGTHCTGGWVGHGAGLDRCGKSRPTGIRSPDLPARSESLYRLRYPGSKAFYTSEMSHCYLIYTSIQFHLFLQENCWILCSYCHEAHIFWAN